MKEIGPRVRGGGSANLEAMQWRIQDFPEVGGPTLRGAPTYDFAKFSQKLHEIQRIWTAEWGVPRAPN